MGEAVVSDAFNINESVWVRLNDAGREIHRKQWQEIARDWPRWEYRPPVEVEGWSRWQLWALMQDFGPHIGLGLIPPFETEIRFTEPHAKGEALNMPDGAETTETDRKE